MEGKEEEREKEKERKEQGGTMNAQCCRSNMATDYLQQFPSKSGVHFLLTL